jgi:hypothetical protein
MHMCAAPGNEIELSINEMGGEIKASITNVISKRVDFSMRYTTRRLEPGTHQRRGAWSGARDTQRAADWSCDRASPGHTHGALLTCSCDRSNPGDTTHGAVLTSSCDVASWRGGSKRVLDAMLEDVVEAVQIERTQATPKSAPRGGPTKRHSRSAFAAQGQDKPKLSRGNTR